MKFVLQIVATAVAVGVAAFLVPGITVLGPTLSSRLLSLTVVAVVIAGVNAFVRPVVTFLSGCLIVLTFGLFLLVVNAAMLMLASSIAQFFGVGFYVDGFWPALFGAIIISVVSGAVNGILGTHDAVH